jgi:CHAT domain-containing protein
LLTALEVENLDLWGTELVVLSACETGLGEVQVGEGVLGLRRAFQLAGAQTVVASLWKVPDAETEQLMTNFLGRWLKGQGKAAALRQAQIDMIRSLRASSSAARREAPPLYWAGFICHGRPD